MVLAKLFIALILFSCATKVTHGVIIDEKALTNITPNVSTTADVQNIIGSPSFIIGEKWYYATTINKYRAFLMPTVLKHNVYELSFSQNILKNINYITEKDIIRTAVPMYKITTNKPNLKEIYNAN